MELKNGFLVDKVHSKPPGFNLSRKLWTRLNRIRTGQNRCNHFLHKLHNKADPKLECSADKKSMEYIVNECTKRMFNDTLA